MEDLGIIPWKIRRLWADFRAYEVSGLYFQKKRLVNLVKSKVSESFFFVYPLVN